MAPYILLVFLWPKAMLPVIIPEGQEACQREAEAMIQHRQVKATICVPQRFYPQGKVPSSKEKSK